MVVAIVVLIILVVVFVVLYNTLIGLKNRVENTFSGIDVLLKKRYDLIPDLVATVKRYTQYEQETLTNIAALRARAVSGQVTGEGRIQLENRLSEELGNLMISIENYPDLKANQNYLNLQQTLTEIEEQLSAARRFYNTTVTEYNNAVEMFPTNVVAGMMSYRRKQLFEAPANERQKQSVSNLFNQ